MTTWPCICGDYHSGVAHRALGHAPAPAVDLTLDGEES